MAADGGIRSDDIFDKILYGFQLATAQGPLCHEPMRGVVVFLEEISTTDNANPIHTTTDDTNIVDSTTEKDHHHHHHQGSASENLGSLTSEVIKTTRDSIRQGFLDWSPRLCLALYSCEIQASSEFFPLSSSYSPPYRSTNTYVFPMD